LQLVTKNCIRKFLLPLYIIVLVISSSGFIASSVKATDQRIAQITSELSTQKVIQKHCDSYRLCRKVIEDCKSAKNPKAYRTKHQAEYQLHDSLKKELQDLGITKIPSSNKIQKRIEHLESEQAATVREKQELQKKQKTLDIIQQNFTVLLNAPHISNNDINRTVAPPLQH
jgi:arsenate reductase-like glutaredoxin family protein